MTLVLFQINFSEIIFSIAIRIKSTLKLLYNSFKRFTLIELVHMRFMYILLEKFIEFKTKENHIKW